MIDLITEASRFQSFCQHLGWKFCFIGGLPVQHWGEPRLTRDVDVTILTGFGAEQDFVSAILKSYQPRRPDAEPFPLPHRGLLVQTTSAFALHIQIPAL